VTWNSIRLAVANWIRPDPTITSLQQTIKTQQEQLVASRKEVADARAAQAASITQLATVTGALAAKDQTIASQASDLQAWEGEGDADVKAFTDGKAAVDATITAAGTPAVPAAPAAPAAVAGQ
jgi:peptidoglycan hydrolase CwlO-like protein